MKQKIIFCIPELVIGGVEIALCELLIALNQLNLYDISLITKRYIAHDRFNTFFENNNITLYDMSLKWKCFKFIERLFQKILIKHTLKKYDVIIDFKYTEFLNYHKNFNVPKIAWLHCSFVHLKNNIGISKMLGYNRIICVSKQLAKDIQEYYPELNEKAVSIYNPLHLIQILKASEETLYTTHSPYFTAVQRLDHKEKDVATIIKAFNVFSKNNLNYYLYIVGGGRNIKNI